ncbi:MAG: crossover junction endodeoxyribonuclease RuvC [Saprospiraceae bacterium]|nr:crossover junction endodeoxyribonuclease RuvC [Saprospiraceae bacterium]
MLIVGIDPGTRATGYGFLESDSGSIKLIEVGTIEPKKTDPLQKRILKIYTILEKLIQQYQPDVLVLEKLFAHYKHPATSAVIGHVRGVICLVAAKEKIDLSEYSVKRIRKAVTGNGNASKVQTRSVVSHILSVDEKKLTLDASDALALALGYIYMNK